MSFGNFNSIILIKKWKTTKKERGFVSIIMRIRDISNEMAAVEQKVDYEMQERESEREKYFFYTASVALE